MGKTNAYENVHILIPKRLRIYQRTDVVSDSYYARASFPPQKGYRTWSTKTTDVDEAKRTAKNAYYELAGRQSINISTKRQSLVSLFKEFLDYKDRLRRRTSESEKTTYRRKFERFIEPHFSNLPKADRVDDINKIRQHHMDGYWDFRHNYWQLRRNDPQFTVSKYGHKRFKYMNAVRMSGKKPAFATLEIESQLFRSFFNFCVKRGHLSSNNIPDVINPVQKEDKVNVHTRGVFSLDEYRKLRDHIMSRASDPKELDTDKRKGRYTRIAKFRAERMRAFFFTASAFGLRPSELKALKFKHVLLEPDEKDPDVQYSIVNLPAALTKMNPDGSRKGRRVYSFDNHLAYNRIHVRWKKVLKEILGRADPDDYLFPKWRNPDKYGIKKPYEHADMGVPFYKMLRDIGMHKDIHGRGRSVYALRKFYITMRIKHGVPLPALALNTGNTIAVMWKYYVDLSSDDMKEYLTRRNDTSTRDELLDLYGKHEVI